MWNPVDDLRRIYNSAVDIKNTGDTNAHVTRRDAIKIGGVFVAGGVADFTEDGDLDSYDSVANVVGGVTDAGGEFVDVDVDPMGPFNDKEPGGSGRRNAGDTGDTRNGSSGSGGINNYSRFESGFQNQNSESLEYVEGALEEDPGTVSGVSFESDGLYVDSTVVEWDNPKMDGAMRDYLEKAEKSGNLADWLSTYEQRNL